jgi:ABC-type antimicrobial peptide transport system permease subunit
LDIEHIFNFQRAVYEDFMVDRTEIIFSPRCIDYTLGYDDKYIITMEARMLEDRWLETGIDKYNKNLLAMVNELKQKEGKQKNRSVDFLETIDITMIPGRNDFSFKLIVKNDAFFKEKYPNRQIKDAYFKIIDWLDQDQEKNKNKESKSAMRMLSHIETYIGKVIK